MKSEARPQAGTPGLQALPIGLDELAAAPDTPFLQRAYWGRHKARFDWEARAFRLRAPDGTTSTLLVLLRRFGRGQSLAYVPHGPRRDFVDALGMDPGKALAQIARVVGVQFAPRPLCVRFDPDWAIAARPAWESGEGEEAAESPAPATTKTLSNDPRTGLELAPLRRAPADIQPPDTVLLDLRPGAEALLAGMKPKTRYNTRLAEKKGVQVETATIGDLPLWYRLYQETAERDRIAVHSLAYYQALLEALPGQAELLLARHEGDLLAGIIMLYAGDRATYLYGASANLKRNLMPAYLLQWTGIRHAIERGCSSYDFFGIPPGAEPGHPMHGLYQFKTGFGGTITSYPGSWDAVLRPFAYGLYRLLEAMRMHWFRRIRKR